MRRAWIPLALLLALDSAPARAAVSPEDTRILEAASADFRAGAAALDADRPAARRHLERAIAGYQRLIDESRHINGGLYYNIGNAHLLLGDQGHAILNYRRAQRLTPHDPNLQANLAHARRRVPNRVETPATERVRRVLLFWHDETAPALRFRVFLLAYIAGWTAALLRISGLLRAGGWWPAIAGNLLAAAMLASLIVEHRQRQSAADAVIVAPQTIARQGPDASVYEPSFTEPLHAGVEVTIVEHRPLWVLARLADGRQAWLEAEAVEPVRTDPAAR